MATEVISGPLGEERILAASGGAALTTTASYTQFLKGVNYIVVTPRAFSASTVLAQWTLNPYLVVLKTTGSMITGNIDYSENAQDANANTNVNLVSLDTLANGDFLLVGGHLPFRGVYCDVNGANDQESTLTVSYWNTATWTDIADTDGTISGTTTMAVDGLVYWTVPTTWKADTLTRMYPELNTSPLDAVAVYKDIPLYWTRWEVSAALGTATTLHSMVAANRDTAYPEFLSGQTREMTVKTREVGGYGCIEHKTTAGTAYLIILGSARKESKVS